jgi:hypothetical protein
MAGMSLELTQVINDLIGIQFDLMSWVQTNATHFAWSLPLGQAWGDDETTGR